jgi:hypothetical protein
MVQPGISGLVDELHALHAGICPACGAPLPPRHTRTREFTCSETCHRAWIDQVIERKGETCEIRSTATGQVYLVPTRVILEVGITHADLVRFPVKP